MVVLVVAVGVQLINVRKATQLILIIVNAVAQAIDFVPAYRYFWYFGRLFV
jgi:hypothetical protein